MKDREELKRLATMVLDGSARIADLRRMAQLVLAGDEVFVQAPPIVGTVGGKTTTMLDWLNAAFASGSPGTAPPFTITATLSPAQARAVFDEAVREAQRETPAKSPTTLVGSSVCRDPEDHYQVTCELERGHDGDHRNFSFGRSGMRWPRAIGGR